MGKVSAFNDWSRVRATRLVGWEDGSEDRAVLLLPRFRGRLTSKWIQPRLKRPFHRLHLDEFGSFVWRKIDGQTEVAALVVAMREHFGDRSEPALERLTKFLTLLSRHGCARLLTPLLP